jgi:hypothetical protein
MATLEKGSKEWNAAYDRLFFMVAYAQKRLNDLTGDISTLKSQISIETKWANPKKLPEGELPKAYRDYLKKVNHLETSIAKFAVLEAELKKDLKVQRETLERISGKAVTDRMLEKQLNKMGRAKIALSNKEEGALLQNRLLLAKREIDVALLRLDIYMGRVQILVEAQTKDMRSEIMAQKQIFEGYKASLEKLENDNSDLLVDVSTATFENVEKRFNSVMLRADVGILDLAWNRKESRTKKITDLVEERNVRLELLRQEFGEIADEEEE